MRAMSISQLNAWEDRGRWAAFFAVACAAAVVAYVYVTFQNLSPLIPFGGSLLALFGNSQRTAVKLRVVALAIVFLFTAISMASIGLFFIPAIAALVTSIVRTDVRSAS